MMNSPFSRYGRVALVMGGQGAEREVSLDGGKAVADALRRLGVTLEVFDGIAALMQAVVSGRVDRVFNLLHGRGGEDGELQGALAAYGVPVTGSGILGSAVTMDKIASKRLWRGAEIPTPSWRVVDARVPADIQTIVDALGLPVFVKPAREGSSVGMSKVQTVDELGPALELATRYDRWLLVEAMVTGAEYTAGILDGQALPLIRIETPRAFYDYEAKYLTDDTEYHIPCGLDAASEAHCQRIALRAFEVLGGSGWGRVDFLLDGEGAPWMIDVNTTPGMTSHSLVPKAAAATGVDFDQLVGRILATSGAPEKTS